MTHHIGFLERLQEAVEQAARQEAKAAGGQAGRMRRPRASFGRRLSRHWVVACGATVAVLAAVVAASGVPLGWYTAQKPVAVPGSIAAVRAPLSASKPSYGLAPGLRALRFPHATTIAQLALDPSGQAWIAGADKKQTALVAFWQDGAWKRLPPPPAPPGGYVQAIGPLAEDDVWASGGDALLHWDGTAWKSWPLPSSLGRAAPPGADDVGDVLRFFAFSPTDVWALGNQPGPLYHDISDGPKENSRGNAPLTLHWNGTAWSDVAMPKLSYRRSSLSELSRSGAETWAVGYLSRLVGIHGTGGAAASITRFEPVVLRLQDGAWSRVDFPNMGEGGTGLMSITALANDDVWVLGSVQPPEYRPGSYYALVMRWDGSSWHEVTGPHTDAMPDWCPRSMVAISDADVWMLGTDDQGKTRVKHWDGAAWSDSPLPGADERGAGSHGSDSPMLVASGAADVWASAGKTILPDDPLLWRWDGHSWAKVAVAVPL